MLQILLLIISLRLPQVFGIGVIIGDPTGISINIEKGNIAYAGAIAWKIPERLHLHGDYVVNFEIENEEEIPGIMNAYMGGGGFFQISKNDIFLGIRVPFGLKYAFKDFPLDVFFEVVPGFLLIPETALSLQGGVGIRIYPTKIR